jgi:hypothetical protein
VAAQKMVLTNCMYRRLLFDLNAEKLFFMALNCGTVYCGAMVAQ